MFDTGVRLPWRDVDSAHGRDALGLAALTTVSDLVGRGDPGDHGAAVGDVTTEVPRQPFMGEKTVREASLPHATSPRYKHSPEGWPTLLIRRAWWDFSDSTRVITITDAGSSAGPQSRYSTFK